MQGNDIRLFATGIIESNSMDGVAKWFLENT